MSPPSFETMFQSLQGTARNITHISNYRNLSLMDAAKIGEMLKISVCILTPEEGIYVIQVYGFFVVGEMVGRRSLVGYQVSSSAAHSH